MKQNRNVSYLNQNKTKLNYVIKFSLIECSLFITSDFTNARALVVQWLERPMFGCSCISSVHFLRIFGYDF